MWLNEQLMITSYEMIFRLHNEIYITYRTDRSHHSHRGSQGFYHRRERRRCTGLNYIQTHPVRKGYTDRTCRLRLIGQSSHTLRHTSMTKVCNCNNMPSKYYKDNVGVKNCGWLSRPLASYAEVFRYTKMFWSTTWTFFDTEPETRTALS